MGLLALAVIATREHFLDFIQMIDFGDVLGDVISTVYDGDLWLHYD